MGPLAGEICDTMHCCAWQLVKAIGTSMEMSEVMQPIATDCTVSRRTLISAMMGGALTSMTGSLRVSAATPTPAKIRAIAFDAFPIFDARAVAALAQTRFGETGRTLANVWTAKLFDYTWLVTSAGRYEEFEALAGTSLQFAADSVGITLSDEVRKELIEVYAHLNVWPDVKPALERLRSAGIRLRFLSNLSEETLHANMRNAGIEQYFEAPLSTDRVRQFKPAPAAYHMAVDAFRLPKEAIGFAAFGGWDAAGATWFGYRTAWVNRLGVQTETLEAKPEMTSASMSGVLALAGIEG
jgi:2-haloacid dehalogenase